MVSGRAPSTCAIPEWTAMGVLPPIAPEDPVSQPRSPYRVRLWDLVERFNTSVERNKILRGFLDFRAELHALGIADGFQWLNGSFVENVEKTEGRSPNDIDVVTFFRLPADHSQADLLEKNRSLFVPKSTKENYHVDAYFFGGLGVSDPKLIIDSAIYWYGVWSHRRDERWKGFLEVDLAPQYDVKARVALQGETSEDR